MVLVSRFRQAGLAFAAAAMTSLALVGPCSSPAFAQGQSGAWTPAPNPAASAHAKQHAKRSVHPRKPKAEIAPPVAVAPTHPPDPPPPAWPVNDKAVAATINWNGRDLTIAASNSSLGQVLRDVSTATGVKVQGIASAGGDQRIYGSYGPGAARDVLSQLLEGSGYNVLMVGDSGEGTPRELVLSSKTSTGAAAQNPAAGADAEPGGEDETAEEPEQPEQPEQPDLNLQRRPPGFPPQVPGQTREQIMQQMQMRQIQDLQQQQQQNQQPPPQFPNQ